MVYEILENNSVINSVVADLEFMQSQYPDGNYRVMIDVPSTPTIPSEPVKRHITQLAFMERFTDAEAIAIDLASIGATPEAAAMRRYQAKVQAAKFIDLDSESTRTGVIALETIGLLSSGRALEILDSPILDSEKA